MHGGRVGQHALDLLHHVQDAIMAARHPGLSLDVLVWKGKCVHRYKLDKLGRGGRGGPGGRLCPLDCFTWHKQQRRRRRSGQATVVTAMVGRAVLWLAGSHACLCAK